MAYVWKPSDTLADQLRGQGVIPGGQVSPYNFSGGQSLDNSGKAIDRTGPLPSTVTPLPPPSPYVPPAPAPPNVTYPTPPPAPARPTVQRFSYSQDATNYPTYLKNLGEIGAQDQFEHQVNQGIKAGNAFQGYQAALASRNTNRLQYTAQAGQEQFKVESGIADQLAAYNKQLLDLYGLDISERAKQLDYLAQIAGLDVQQRQQAITYALGVGDQALTKRGQDMSYTLGGRGQDVTSRGQDLSYDAALKGVNSKNSQFDAVMTNNAMASRNRNYVPGTYTGMGGSTSAHTGGGPGPSMFGGNTGWVGGNGGADPNSMGNDVYL